MDEQLPHFGHGPQTCADLNNPTKNPHSTTCNIHILSPRHSTCFKQTHMTHDT